MRETCAPLNEKIDELRQELQFERKSHRAELIEVETESDAVLSDLAQATSKLAQMQSENRKQLESYNQYLVEKIAETNDEIDKIVSGYEECLNLANNNRSKVEQNLVAFKAEVAKCKSAEMEICKENENLKQTVQRLNEMIEILKTERDRSQAEITRLTEEVRMEKKKA